jgi:branched-subunit amino acid ABC-type transport system permease component
VAAELFLPAWVAPALINTLLVGSLYTLSAVGVTVVIAVVKVPNFAQGDLVTIGAYVAAFSSNWLEFPFNLFLGAILAAATSAFVAVLSDEVVYKPLQKRGTSTVGVMAASIGISMFIKYSLYIIGGIYSFSFLSSRTSLVANLPLYATNSLVISNLFFWTVPTTIALIIVLQLTFVRTKPGKAMRAVGTNPSLAHVSGVNIRNVRRFTWAISGGLAGLSGAFWAAFVLLTPELAISVMLRAFAASTIGGLVSFPGTIFGGYVIGAAENLLAEFLNFNAGLSLIFQPALVFGIMVLFLLFAPEGIAEAGSPLRDLGRKLKSRFRPSAKLG